MLGRMFGVTGRKCPKRKVRQMETQTAKAITVKDLYTEAHKAGMQAATKCTPTPMVVARVIDIATDEIDPSTIEVVDDGVCGFAWINIRPARGAFVTYLKAAGIGSSDSYYGGYTIWVSDFNQSMTRKYEYAKAFAQVLESWGITANASSRMD